MHSSTDIAGAPNGTPAAILSDFDIWVRHRYTETVGDAGDTGVDKTVAADTITTLVEQAIATGSMRLPIDVLRRLVHGVISVVDEKARRKTNARIAEVAAVLGGGTLFGDDDPLLESVALIGDGTRKTWRHVNHDDIDAMQLIKARHAQDAATASAEFAAESNIVKKALRAIGHNATIGELLGEA